MSTIVQPVTKVAAADARVSCTHCDLPVPAGLVQPLAEQPFCCGGCRAAWQLIHSCGLDAFYRVDAGRNARPINVVRASAYEAFDDPAFLSKYARPLSNDTHEISLVIDGIHCAACVWLIEKLPRMLPGVTDARVNWARQTARIRWRIDKVNLSAIAGTLDRVGYPPHPAQDNPRRSRRQLENRRQLVRLGIAAAAAGNNMLIAAALYLGMFSWMSIGITQLLRMASGLVGVVSLLGPGQVFFRGAIVAIRTRTPHMDLPIGLALAVGGIAGTVNVIRGSGEIWFDSLSVLVFLLLLGRWIQFRQQNHAVDAVEMLYRLTPQRAHKLVSGVPVDTMVDQIVEGDLLQIANGDLLPVDAVIEQGTTHLDEAVLTGESRLNKKVVGDEVLAGTKNCGSPVRVRAIATGRDTRLSKIVDLVEQAALEKPAVVLWANRVGGYFVALVLLAAAVTFVWTSVVGTGGVEVAVERMVALLVVACPCALALATPLTISVALGRSAQQKIMIKSGDVLQRLNRPGTLWLDKTGTLTVGRLQVVRHAGDYHLLPLLAALERCSNHPVANAIVQFVDGEFAKQKPVAVIAEIEETPGAGISGILESHHLLAGTAEHLQRHGIPINRQQQRLAQKMLAIGLSPCWVAMDGRVAALLALGDSVRADAKSAVGRLQQAGWSVGILSGDHPSTVRAVAEELGIDQTLAFGSVSPEQKADFIRSSLLRPAGEDPPTVVMVGDGVNDSAALSAASVGIAVHGGAEASLAAAPVYLAQPGLEPVLKLLDISRVTRRTMRLSLIISLAYNVTFASLAAAGWITPLVAAVVMPVSSLTVVAIALTAGKTTTVKD